MALTDDTIWYALIGLYVIAGTLPITVVLLLLWMLIPARLRRYPPLSGIVVVPLVALGTPAAAAWLLFTHPPSLQFFPVSQTQGPLALSNDTTSLVTIHRLSDSRTPEATIAPGGVYRVVASKKGCDRVLECRSHEVTIVVLDADRRQIGWFIPFAADGSPGDGPRLCVSDLTRNRRYYDSGLQGRRAVSSDPCAVQ